MLSTTVVLSPAIRRRGWLKNAYAGIPLTAMPFVILFMVRNPVDLLSVGGIVAAAHTPVVVFLTLFLNRTRPPPLRPGWFATGGMVLAGAFFAIFAAVYLLDLLGIGLVLGGDAPGAGTPTSGPATPAAG